jgi:hypothetical protein
LAGADQREGHRADDDAGVDARQERCEGETPGDERRTARSHRP